MKVLMISKACVSGSYQRKLEHIGSHRDVELTVAVPPYWRDERGMLRLERRHINGYELTVEPIIFNGSFHLHLFPRIDRLIDKIKPDIVHIDEEPYNLATWHILVTARKRSARTLFFSWQNIARRYPWPFNILEASVLQRADFAICGSKECHEVWRNKGYVGQTAIIPQFGVDPDLFAWKDPLLDGERGITIGYIGRLVKAKGVDLLLRAVADLDDDVILRLVGSGPQRNDLRHLATQLGITERMELVHWIKSTEMPKQLREMDVLVLPSLTQTNWKEQFGRVLLEGMASGVPVVGSSSGEIPNTIGDAGIIFPEGDIDALASALRKLTRDPDLCREYAERGRARIMAHYTQAQVAAATVRVYRNIMLDNQASSGHVL